MNNFEQKLGPTKKERSSSDSTGTRPNKYNIFQNPQENEQAQKINENNQETHSNCEIIENNNYLILKPKSFRLSDLNFKELFSEINKIYSKNRETKKKKTIIFELHSITHFNENEIKSLKAFDEYVKNLNFEVTFTIYHKFGENDSLNVFKLWLLPKNCNLYKIFNRDKDNFEQNEDYQNLTCQYIPRKDYKIIQLQGTLSQDTLNSTNIIAKIKNLMTQLNQPIIINLKNVTKFDIFSFILLFNLNQNQKESQQKESQQYNDKLIFVDIPEKLQKLQPEVRNNSNLNQVCFNLKHQNKILRFAYNVKQKIFSQN
jgi:ABC-type transporter Mla MlaB component